MIVHITKHTPNFFSFFWRNTIKLFCFHFCKMLDGILCNDKLFFSIKPGIEEIESPDF